MIRRPLTQIVLKIEDMKEYEAAKEERQQQKQQQQQSGASEDERLGTASGFIVGAQERRKIVAERIGFNPQPSRQIFSRPPPDGSALRY